MSDPFARPAENPNESPMEPGGPPPPPTSLSAPDKDSCQWAMFCHLASLAQFVLPSLGNIIGPLIVWLMKKDQHPFIDYHGKESLNFQISMSIYIWASSIILALTCIGVMLLFITIPVLAVIDVVFAIIAGLKASNGEAYQYPLTIRFFK